MLWSEIKKWAKAKGYETLKDNNDNNYYWAKIDETSNMESVGVATSVSKLAKAIYNHLSENRWVDYQNSYKSSREKIHEQSIQNY